MHPSPVVVGRDELEHALLRLFPRLAVFAVRQLAHDGEHPFLADDDAAAPELAVDPAVPVAAIVEIEPLGDEASGASRSICASGFLLFT